MHTKRYTLMLEALRHYGRTLKNTHDYPQLHALRALINHLPRDPPYIFTLSVPEWEMVSRALRPYGSNPESGSFAARWYALYQWMLRTHVRYANLDF